MNKHFHVITINGFRGVLTAVFIIFGLVSGFIISPGWVCMKLWNIFAAEYSFRAMNIYQGVLLWAVIALVLYAVNNKRALIGFGAYSALSPEQIKDIMQRAKARQTSIISEMNKIKAAAEKSAEAAPDEAQNNSEQNNKEEIGG